MSLEIIILAAGQGTRMRSDLPKVLHQLGGKSLLEHVVATAQALNPEKIYIVYGDKGELLQNKLAHLTADHKNIVWVLQQERLGTGHAVMQALPKIADHADVLILYGDVPLVAKDTLQKLQEKTPVNGIGMVTVHLDDPTGYGRILRDANKNIVNIIEHKDAKEFELQIKEINSGIYLAKARILKNYLPKLEKHNAQGEYYLTDIIAMSVKDDRAVVSVAAKTPEEVLGINDRVQLARMERYFQLQNANKLMQEGVTLIDPNRFDLRGEILCKSDVIIDVNVIIQGKVSIGKNSKVGANTILHNVIIGDNVEIRANCVIEGAVVADDCVIGPFARIRPESQISEGARVGNFVEVKKSKIGKNSKASHLTYLGDTVIGENVNIGAGTITCNYDGANKFQTIIEDGAFIGSNTALVAPVRIGKNATIGAGSTITTDAPAEKLTIARGKQVTIENWQRPIKKKKD